MSPYEGARLSVKQPPLYVRPPRSSLWPFWLTALEGIWLR